MAEQNLQKQNLTANNESETTAFSISDVLKLMLANWYWFVISVALCLGAAYFYLARTQPIYSRTATILVKDPRKGGYTDMAAFRDVTGVMQRHNVDNEIFTLQSRRLMAEVVRKLNLETNYSTRSGLRTVPLYKQTPIDVQFINSNEFEGLGFTAIVLEDGKQVRLSSFSRSGISPEESEQELLVRLGDTVTSPVGNIVITPTFYLTPEYRNREIYVSKWPVAAAAATYRGALNCEVINKSTQLFRSRCVMPFRSVPKISSIHSLTSTTTTPWRRSGQWHV